jgi:hypothetical protein
MSHQDWVIFLLVFYFIWRLDRLGKQIEAVRDNLLIELGNEETRTEVLQDHEWEKKERSKERRHFWIFSGVIVLAPIVWYAVSRQ